MAYKLDLSHSGIPGMKWHRRRYQYPDGSLTPEGRKHYGVGEGKRPSKPANAPKQKEQPKPEEQDNRSIEEKTADLQKQTAYQKAINDSVRAQQDYKALLAPKDLDQKQVSKGKEFLKTNGSKLLNKTFEAILDVASKAAAEKAKSYAIANGWLPKPKTEHNWQMTTKTHNAKGEEVISVERFKRWEED